MTRGLRNCNPLNIRRVAGTEWRGQCAEQTDKGFVQFEFLEWGLRAAFCLLRTYRDKYQAVCIRDIISRWAPPTENDTERYIQNVCLWTGFGGLQRLTERDWPRLVRAMARQECGTLLDEETINKGFELFKSINQTAQDPAKQFPRPLRATGDFRAMTECHCGSTKESESPLATEARVRERVCHNEK